MDHREVYFIADDFGASLAINEAIIHSHQSGALHGASLMMGQPATDAAVALARRHPTLQIGWHLHLCDSVPVTRADWPWGRSPLAAGVGIGLTPGGYRLMRQEVAAQWELFEATGLPGAFINSHHHLHVHPWVYRRMREVVPESFAGWVRLGQVRRFGAGPHNWWTWFLKRHRQRCPWATSDTLWGVDRLRKMTAAEIRRVLPTLPAGRHEFLFHPRSAGDADSVALEELR